MTRIGGPRPSPPVVFRGRPARRPRRAGGMSADDQLLAAARRRLTGQVALAVSAAILIVVSVAYLIVSYEQRQDVDRQLRSAAARAEDVDDPPDGITLFLRRTGEPLQASHGAPANLADLASIDATARDGVTRSTQHRLGQGDTYKMITVRRDGLIIQTAFDLSDLNRQTDRLLLGLGFAGVSGIGAVLMVSITVGRRAVAPLRDALDRQRQFVADAAHELRTPLTLLHTRAQVFERAAGKAGVPALAAEAGEIVADSRRLADIVEDLLVSAELAHSPGRRTPVDLGRVAHEVAAAAQAYAAELGVTLTVTVADLAAGRAMPAEADRRAVVLGAEPALRRAVSALLDNALGHTQSDGSVTMTVAPANPSGVVTLRITDTGQGLEPTAADDLFTRFHRGQQVGDRRRFGLGLALVQEIAANHGGTVTAAGAVGRGATFTLSLPAAGEHDSPSAAAQARFTYGRHSHA